MAAAAVQTLLSIVVCHGGPANHFAEYIPILEKAGIPVQVYAHGPGFDILRQKGLADRMEKLEGLGPSVAKEIAQKCQKSAFVLVDVGHPWDVEVATALRDNGVRVVAYWDNPEKEVPGGYAETAAKVREVAHNTWFANANMGGSDGVGIGFYSLNQAADLQAMRQQGQKEARDRFFLEHKIEDVGQEILVYLGGNNGVYYEEAFPTLLSAMEGLDSKQYLVVLQQHPGAKQENRDGAQFLEKGVVSSWGSLQMLQIADRVLYYQTSMSPLLGLAGICAIQIGKDVYEDVLVREGICATAADGASLRAALQRPPVEGAKERVLGAIGYRKDWKERLVQAAQEACRS